MILSEFGMIDTVKIQDAIQDAIAITNRNIIKFQDFFPCRSSINEKYPYSFDHTSYHFGFWCGLVWLSYELTRDEKIKCYGQKLTKAICHTLNKQEFPDCNLGFYAIPSAGADYRFTGNPASKRAIIDATNALLQKYHSESGIICSHNRELKRDHLICLISNLINAQLLLHAYRQTGNQQYCNIAQKSIETTIQNNIRPDGKTFFRSYYHKRTRELTRIPSTTSTLSTNSGHSLRAYGWTLYGLSLLYAQTSELFYAELFETVFTYLSHHICPIDFSSYLPETNESQEESFHPSRALIALALTEMLKREELPDTTLSAYAKTASLIINDLVDCFAISPDTNNEGLLSIRNRTEGYPLRAYLDGDYFYLELLMNSVSDRHSFWHAM